MNGHYVTARVACNGKIDVVLRSNAKVSVFPARRAGDWISAICLDRADAIDLRDQLSVALAMPQPAVPAEVAS